eukprot:scaffold24373_cov20-Tisochrysis_lutea.AAC.1
MCASSNSCRAYIGSKEAAAAGAGGDTQKPQLRTLQGHFLAHTFMSGPPLQQGSGSCWSLQCHPGVAAALAAAAVLSAPAAQRCETRQAVRSRKRQIELHSQGMESTLVQSRKEGRHLTGRLLQPFLPNLNLHTQANVVKLGKYVSCWWVDYESELKREQPCMPSSVRNV